MPKKTYRKRKSNVSIPLIFAGILVIGLAFVFSGSKSNRVVLIKSLKGNASAFPFFFLFFCSNNVAKILLNQNSHTKVAKGSKTECHSLNHFNQVILPFKFSVRIGVF